MEKDLLLDSTEQQEYQTQSSETAEVIETAETAETTETVESSEVPVIDGILEDTEPPFSFESFDEIDVSTLPPEVANYVTPILQHALEMEASLEAEKVAYEDVRERFSSLLENLDEAQKGNIQPLVEQYETVNEAFTQISTENVDLAHRLFLLEYPNFNQESDTLKRAFAESLVHPGFNDRHLGDGLYDKMVDAYKLTLYRNGGSTAKVQTQQVAEPVAVMRPSAKSVKQSLVSGGEMAPNLPSINLADMSYDDIMSRGEHLLDL